MFLLPWWPSRLQGFTMSTINFANPPSACRHEAAAASLVACVAWTRCPAAATNGPETCHSIPRCMHRTDFVDRLFLFRHDLHWAVSTRLRLLLDQQPPASACLDSSGGEQQGWCASWFSLGNDCYISGRVTTFMIRSARSSLLRLRHCSPTPHPRALALHTPRLLSCLYCSLSLFYRLISSSPLLVSTSVLSDFNLDPPSTRGN